MLTNKSWSPYISGVIIGLLQIPAFLLIETALGTSSSYVKLIGHVGQLFNQNITQIEYFNKYMTKETYEWQLSLIIGMILGGYISTRLSSSKRPKVSVVWQEMGLKTLKSRYIVAFMGGVILLFGARFAGGCTSGHGLSGTGQLAVSSFVTVLCMFIGGIITAKLLFRSKS